MVEPDVLAHARAQGQRIKALREHTKLSKTLLSSRLGFTTTQAYDLYERGASVIRLDKVHQWAEAFGMPTEDFLAVLRGDLDPSDDWTFRSALRGHIPESMIDKLAETWEGRPLLNQQAAVEAILEMAEEHRREMTQMSRKSNAV